MEMVERGRLNAPRERRTRQGNESWSKQANESSLDFQFVWIWLCAGRMSAHSSLPLIDLMSQQNTCKCIRSVKYALGLEQCSSIFTWKTFFASPSLLRWWLFLLARILHVCVCVCEYFNTVMRFDEEWVRCAESVGMCALTHFLSFISTPTQLLCIIN